MVIRSWVKESKHFHICVSNAANYQLVSRAFQNVSVNEIKYFLSLSENLSKIIESLIAEDISKCFRDVWYHTKQFMVGFYHNTNLFLCKRLLILQKIWKNCCTVKRFHLKWNENYWSFNSLFMVLWVVFLVFK